MIRPKRKKTASHDALEDALQEAIEAVDEQQVADIVESISSQEALRQCSLMKADERDQLISILSPEAAAKLIEESPVELAVAID